MDFPGSLGLVRETNWHLLFLFFLFTVGVEFSVDLRYKTIIDGFSLLVQATSILIARYLETFMFAYVQIDVHT